MMKLQKRETIFICSQNLINAIIPQKLKNVLTLLMCVVHV